MADEKWHDLVRRLEELKLTTGRVLAEAKKVINTTEDVAKRVERRTAAPQECKPPREHLP